MQDKIQNLTNLTQATTTTQDLIEKPRSLAESFPMVFDLLINNLFIDIKEKGGEFNFENEDVKSLFQLTLTHDTNKNRELASLILSNSLKKEYSSEGLKELLIFLKKKIFLRNAKKILKEF